MHFLYVDAIPRLVNNAFPNKEPWQIVAVSSSTTLAMIWLWNFIHQDESKYFNIIYIYTYMT